MNAAFGLRALFFFAAFFFAGFFAAFFAAFFFFFAAIFCCLHRGNRARRRVTRDWRWAQGKTLHVHVKLPLFLQRGGVGLTDRTERFGDIALVPASEIGHGHDAAQQAVVVDDGHAAHL